MLPTPPGGGPPPAPPPPQAAPPHVPTPQPAMPPMPPPYPYYNQPPPGMPPGPPGFYRPPPPPGVPMAGVPPHVPTPPMPPPPPPPQMSGPPAPAQPAGTPQPPAIDPQQRVRNNISLSARTLFDSLLIQDMLMQVLRLTQEQINALPPNDREAVQSLVSGNFMIQLDPRSTYSSFSEKSVYGPCQSRYLRPHQTSSVYVYLLS